MKTNQRDPSPTATNKTYNCWITNEIIIIVTYFRPISLDASDDTSNVNPLSTVVVRSKLSSAHISARKKRVVCGCCCSVCCFRSHQETNAGVLLSLRHPPCTRHPETPFVLPRHLQPRGPGPLLYVPCKRKREKRCCPASREKLTERDRRHNSLDIGSTRERSSSGSHPFIVLGHAQTSIFQGGEYTIRCVGSAASSLYTTDSS